MSKSAEQRKQQIWIAEAIGEWLASAPRLPLPPSRAQIATMIRRCLNLYSRGNISTLAGLVGVSVHVM